MPILATCGPCVFSVEETFQSVFLAPVILNLLDKAQNDWDDYDEAYHCNVLIQKILADPRMRLEFHTLRKDGRYIGLVLVTSGQIDTALLFKNAIAIDAAEKALVLNYFHIAPEGRGNGCRWLCDILLPHYKKQGFTAAYLKSSHPKAFSLYERLGSCIGTYQSVSDNKRFARNGKLFKIPL